MSPLVMCLFAPLMVTAPAGHQAPAINVLIQQMGSERYREREAATRALQKTGVSALPALRKAAHDNADAEIRLRARQLVQRIERHEIEEVKNGKLSATEKCRRLSKVIERGMEWEHVTDILGEPTSYKSEGSLMSASYPHCGVVIWKRSNGNGKVCEIDKCEAQEGTHAR